MLLAGYWTLEEDRPRGGVGNLGSAPQHIPPGRLQQQDKAGTQKHTWLWWSLAEQTVGTCTAGWEGGPPQEPCISSEQTFHWSRDGGIQEQKQLAMPRSRNMYWYLVSFLQLFYLNIPRFSIHFRNR